MKSYAGVVAVAIAHGATAMPADWSAAPDNGPTLPNGSAVLRNIPAPLLFSTCYPNAGSQKVEGENVQFPCHSEQNIHVYCGENFLAQGDLAGHLNCLTGKGSTLRSDVKCCVRCLNQIGTGDRGIPANWDGYFDGLEKKAEELRSENKGKLTKEAAEKEYAQIDEKLRKEHITPVDIKDRSPEQAAQDKEFVHIPRYCPSNEFKRPQMAGLPLEDSKDQKANGVQTDDKVEKEIKDNEVQADDKVEKENKVPEDKTNSSPSPLASVVLEEPMLFSLDGNSNNVSDKASVPVIITHTWSACMKCVDPLRTEAQRAQEVQAREPYHPQQSSMQTRPEMAKKVSPADLKVLTKIAIQGDKCGCIDNHLPKDLKPKFQETTGNKQDSNLVYINMKLSVTSSPSNDHLQGNTSPSAGKPQGADVPSAPSNRIADSAEPEYCE